VLAVGEQVKFYGDRRWWDVRAIAGGFVVLTRGGDFGQEPVYCVIAWDLGWRGPQGRWGYGAITDEQCAQLARALDGHPQEGREAPELSTRASVRVDLAAVRSAAGTGQRGQR
jgi:hypothetical protein